jgi:hypothetical protein
MRGLGEALCGKRVELAVGYLYPAQIGLTGGKSGNICPHGVAILAAASIGCFVRSIWFLERVHALVRTPADLHGFDAGAQDESSHARNVAL